MIAFRQVDARHPFLWEVASQPPGRWHGEGEGPAHCFADTPDGAWAEFLRYEEISDPADLPTIRRQMWAVEIGNQSAEQIDLPPDILTGGPDTYTRCQQEARTLRARGVGRFAASSAALAPGGARGSRVHAGELQPGAPRDGVVVVIFGPPDELMGWSAAVDGRPSVDLLPRVRHYPPRQVSRRSSRRRAASS
jgi:hypothetical protein